jgi:hypothetical protein
MKLYQLTEEYEKALTQMVDADSGEISEDGMKQLAEIKDDVQEKSLAVARFIQNSASDVEALKREEERLATIRKRLELRNDWLKKYLCENMDACGISEISSPLFRIKMKNCPPSVDVYDAKILPNKYIRVKESISVDKQLIASDTREGIEVPGARIKHGKTVVIR